MILGDAALTMTPPPGGQSRVTIDEIFRRMARRRPDALALADAPNRKTFTDGVSPTARRAASLMPRPTAWSRRSPRGCAAWSCRPTPLSASSCRIS
jgi:hypothetical protein